jgi:apolipoprotein N-acyltransferase
MKIATGIIAIMLGLLVILQSCTISTLSSVTENQATFDAGAAGIFTGFLLFVGGAFAFGLPFVAMIVFALAGLVALLGINEFPDLKSWAGVSVVMALLAFVAWRSDRKKHQTPGSPSIHKDAQ